MRRRAIFADTFYWLALIDPHDAWHAVAQAASRAYAGIPLLTTDEVLVEVMNAFADRRASLRSLALATVREILRNRNIEVVPQSRDTFEAGLAFFESRPDKGYSLTDCISMLTMRAHSVTEALTHDHHFEQEGFVVLLRP
jgi:predicted nucleic acid-binding protein